MNYAQLELALPCVRFFAFLSLFSSLGKDLGHYFLSNLINVDLNLCLPQLEKSLWKLTVVEKMC